MAKHTKQYAIMVAKALESGCEVRRPRAPGKRGRGHDMRHKKVYRGVYVTGQFRQILFPWGIVGRLDGSITCVHYDTKILGVDFINSRITDFEIGRGSISTQTHRSKWTDAFRGVFMHALPDWVLWNYRKWINWEKDSRAVFGRRMPWVQHIDGITWFCWSAFDQKLADEYWASERDLIEDCKGRYFHYDWDEQGRWVRRFINEDAERRWLQREHRRNRGRTQ